jgi:hypothetical protein
MSLMQILNEIHLEAHRWESPDASTILILPHGGRILGLYAPQSEENFFWTHPSLQSAETARAFYFTDGWHNSGGDRTWLAPEFEFFFPNYPQPDPYRQPSQLDPGNFYLETGTREMSLVAHGSLCLYAASQTIQFTLRKTITATRNPLWQVSSASDLNLAYAGYTLRTTITIDEPLPSSPVSVGIWNLLQLPHGGEMIFATHSRGTTVRYMGSISPGDLNISDHAIRYRMRARGENKLGIQAPYLTGRAAYLYGDLGRSSLVIRNFSVNPSAAYVDVPFGSDTNSACAAQACSIDSSLGSFSELEYHAPAIEIPSGQPHCIDESQLWAFSGPQPAVMQAARFLVCAEL